MRLGKYKHYKGKFYSLLHIAIDKDTKEKLAVYQCLYDTPDYGQNPIFVQPLGRFAGQVEFAGKKVKRFEYMESATLTPNAIQDLVTLAFTLEAISDKEGCTTRFVDLANRPLSDFLIAGVNVGKYFRFLAQDVTKDNTSPIFKYFLEALRTTNNLKSSKTINFGLLEIMFPAVYARLLCGEREKVVDVMIELMKRENKEDSAAMIHARKQAWKTSTKAEKKSFPFEQFTNSTSPYQFYMKLYETFSQTYSNYQWADQYKQGLPALCTFLTNFTEQGESLLAQIKETFSKVRNQHPDLKLGIVADMCAAALFLHLSYQVDEIFE